ncbi:MAG: hypothetical protein ACMUIU_16915 [bacterium]
MKRNVRYILFIFVLAIALCFSYIGQTSAYYGLYGMGLYGLYGGLYGFSPFSSYGGLITAPGMFTNIGFSNLLMPYGSVTTSATGMFPHLSAMDLNFLNMMDLSFGGPGLALGRLIGELYGIDLGYETLTYGGSGYGALGLMQPLWGSLGLLGGLYGRVYGLYGGGLGLYGGLYGAGLGLMGGLYGGSLGLLSSL